MTEKLILAFLVLLLIQGFVNLYHSVLVFGRNLRIRDTDIAHLKDLLEKQKIELIRAETTIRQLVGRTISDISFALTPEGIKALPADWMEKCWPDPATLQESLDDER